MAPDREAGYALILREAIRAISDQQAALDALSTRAGFVASAAAIVVSLSGRQLFDEFWTGIWLEVALVSYLGVAAMTGYILWPRRKWRFHFSAARLQWLYLEGPDPLALGLMQRDLALHLDTYFQHNASQIDRMSWALAASISFLLIGTAGLIYHLWR